MARRKPRLNVRLIPGRDDDLIRWLQALDREILPHGEKTQRIKETLRQGLAPEAQVPKSSGAGAVPERLGEVAARLAHMQIENDAALAVIRRYDAPTTCFYLDPPYPRLTRSTQWKSGGYRHEMTPAEHRELAEVLHGIQGLALISSYPNPLYDELYHDWIRVAVETTADNHKRVTEYLWISPAAQQHARQAWLPGVEQGIHAPATSGSSS